MPAALAQFFASGRSGAISPAVIVGVIVMVVAVIAFVVFMERALRKVRIQYPRRQVGEGDGRTEFAPSDQGKPSRRYSCDFCVISAFIANNYQHVFCDGGSAAMSTILAYFGPGNPRIGLLHIDDRVFAFFYTHNVSFKVDDVADNLKIKTALSLVFAQAKDRRTSRIRGEPRACFGSAYLAAVCLLPEILRGQLGLFYFGGTSLLIVVCNNGYHSAGAIASLCASVRKSDSEIAAAW